MFNILCFQAPLALLLAAASIGSVAHQTILLPTKINYAHRPFSYYHFAPFHLGALPDRQHATRSRILLPPERLAQFAYGLRKVND